MVQNTFRIVHFSDVHVGSPPRTLGAWFDKRLLGALNYSLRRSRHVHLANLPRAAAQIQRLGADAVICSGDITSTGTPWEFARAEALLKPLRQPAADRFLYVPGNHDLYVRAGGCRQAVREAFGRLNGGRWELDELPVRRHIGAFTFYLLNGAHPTHPFACSGRLQAAARAALDAWLSEPRRRHEVRVLLNHFPLRREDGSLLPRRRRLHGAEWLDEQLAAGRFDAALCGHIHRPYVRRLDSRRLEVCAGSLTIAGTLSVLDYAFDAQRFTQFWVDVSEDRAVPIPMVENLATLHLE